MLVLFETPAGHALFKLHADDPTRVADHTDLESPDTIKNLVKLHAFSRFSDTTAALSAATALVDSKPSKDLRKFLKKQLSSGDTLAVADSKLGAAIKDKTGLECIFSSQVTQVMRAIRANLDVLLDGEHAAVSGPARNAMVLGLAHSLSRYKLKFSPDKVDTMIVQAISLLDELDKEINIYAMRLREWYGWHFPEMGKIVTDNAEYAKTIDKMGIRSDAAKTDLSSILQPQVLAELQQAAVVSMGTEISEEDVLNIRSLCTQVISLTEYRATLFEYLKNRMAAIAPNLTAMVGELVGARLIAHAGSLLSLAKYPASTVQILGAEKALFRALKTKHATPKYGLIFHASVVGQASAKHKGKISRSLAAKAALSIRVDALGEAGEDARVGEQGRLAIEKRLNQLEGRTEFAVSRLKLGEGLRKMEPTEGAGKRYNNAGDIVIGDGNGERALPDEKVVDVGEAAAIGEEDGETEGKKKKKKKKDKRASLNGDAEKKDDGDDLTTPKKKKKEKKEAKSSEKLEKKKRRRSSGDEDVADEGSAKKKKKKAKRE